MIMRDKTVADRSDSSGSHSRRRYLKAIAGTTVVSGFAGCQGGESSGSSGGNSTNNDGGTAGSGGSTSSGGNEADLAFAHFVTLENDTWKTFVKGLKDATNHFGLGFSTATHGGSQTQDIQAIDSAIAKDADIIMGTPFQDSGVRPVAEKMVDNGIPYTEYYSMAKWYTPLDAGPEFMLYSIPEVVRTGRYTAEVLFDAMGGSGNFVVLAGPSGHVGTNRIEGALQAAEERSDIQQIGDEINGDWTRPSGRKSMSDFISKFGDDIDGVYANNDGMALGAMSILEDNNMSVPVVGYDSFQETAETIKRGKRGDSQPWFAGSFYARAYWQAGYAVVRSLDWLNGYRPEAPERMMWGGGSVVVNDPSEYDDLDADIISADQYLNTIWSDDSSPYDWDLMSRTTGDGWDPQNELVPIRKKEFSQLNWTEDNKPDGYSLPDVYDDSSLFDEVDKKLSEKYRKNPFATDE